MIACLSEICVIELKDRQFRRFNAALDSAGPIVTFNCRLGYTNLSCEFESGANFALFFEVRIRIQTLRASKLQQISTRVVEPFDINYYRSEFRNVYIWCPRSRHKSSNIQTTDISYFL